MLCCGQQAPPPAPTNPLTALGGLFHNMAAGASPTIKARDDFDAAVADYKKCLAVKSANDCEGERHIMDAAAVAAGNGLR